MFRDYENFNPQCPVALSYVAKQRPSSTSSQPRLSVIQFSKTYFRVSGCDRLIKMAKNTPRHLKESDTRYIQLIPSTRRMLYFFGLKDSYVTSFVNMSSIPGKLSGSHERDGRPLSD